MNRTPSHQEIRWYDDGRRAADVPVSERSLLRVWPDIAERLPPEERGVAERHELIGRLTASRRSTATLALHHLYQRDVLARLADNSWQLSLSDPSR